MEKTTYQEFDYIKTQLYCKLTEMEELAKQLSTLSNDFSIPFEEAKAYSVRLAGISDTLEDTWEPSVDC